MRDAAWSRGSGIQAGRALVRLACAHIGMPKPDGTLGSRHDKSDCRPENLRALCQRCHLNLDRADHAARQAANRDARTRGKLAKMGFIQLELGYTR